MVLSTGAFQAPTATYLTTIAKSSLGNLVGKAAFAVKIFTVNAIHGAQSANFLQLLTFGCKYLLPKFSNGPIAAYCIWLNMLAHGNIFSHMVV